MAGPTSQRELFSHSAALPNGLRYESEWLGADDERALLDAVGGLELVEARYHEFTAKRRIATFGFGYDFSTNVLSPAPPLPEFLRALRARVATCSAVPPDAFAQTTVAEYRPGTQLGWHRDVPRFGVVVGVSLGGRARMRLRPYPHRPIEAVRATALDLEPRSIYVLRDDARWRWQHAISPTKTLRYSITFRTMMDERRATPR